MSAPIKSLLKGWRFVTQVFEPKEPEMQIGLPTDVKHVSHIGLEGASASQPSWMAGFKPVEAITKEPSNAIVRPENHDKKVTPEVGIQDSKNVKPKKLRRKSSCGCPDSPSSSLGLVRSKQSRSIEIRSDSPRGSQRSKLSTELSSQDPASVPKPSRRKKPKQHSGSESGHKMKNKANK